MKYQKALLIAIFSLSVVLGLLFYYFKKERVNQVFIIKQNKVYVDRYGAKNGYEEVVGADPNTFVSFSDLSINISLVTSSDYYGKDNQHVYYYNTPILKADLNSYVLLSEGGYAKDNYNVYYKGEIVNDADANHFEYIANWNAEYLGYGKDGENIFIDGILVKNIQYSSFEILTNDHESPSFAIDDVQLYCNGNAIDIKSNESIVLLSNKYWLLGKELFSKCEKAYDINSDIFLLDDYLGIDNKVYFRDIEIKSSDANSFRHLYGIIACDDNWVYYGESISDSHQKYHKECLNNGRELINEQVNLNNIIDISK